MRATVQAQSSPKYHRLRDCNHQPLRLPEVLHCRLKDRQDPQVRRHLGGASSAFKALPHGQLKDNPEDRSFSTDRCHSGNINSREDHQTRAQLKLDPLLHP